MFAITVSVIPILSAIVAERVLIMFHDTDASDSDNAIIIITITITIIIIIE
jgi:hypothetical protein